jgi:hypothetical protein
VNDELGVEATPAPASAAAAPTTVSIREVLGVLPSGEPGPPLNDDELGAYLKIVLATEEEKQRNDRHALRDQFYRDGGVAHMERVIDQVFTDRTIRELRKKWVKHARFTNPLKRVVNEVSTVYAEPAKRSVANDNDNYQQVLRAVGMDQQMLQTSRLLNLHRALLVGFRVRMKPNGTREPVLDVATPANVRAVLHPNDDKLVIGWAVRASHRSARNAADAPCWTLWTDHERVSLRADFSIIGGTWIEHKLGVCPWIPVTLGPPQPGFWPGEEGEDLVAAHVSIWMQGVLLLKESKSATKQAILSGDGTNMARDQAADTEVPGELADGQSADVIDMSMDLSLFRDTASHILEAVANDYGMSAALINHQGVQSAEARELMRKPLEEIRKHQQIPLLVLELAIVVVMSAVLKVDMPELAFDPAGFSMTFGEEQVYLDPAKAFDLYVARRQAGAANTLDYIRSCHPGMTEDQALDLLKKNITVELLRQTLIRPLQELTGATQVADPKDAVQNDVMPKSATATASSPPPASKGTGSSGSGGAPPAAAPPPTK